MRELPTGTVTFVFTDIEGSTRLLHTLGNRYRGALGQHRALLRDAFTSLGGIEVDTQGDAFFVAFPAPQGALRATVRAQQALAEHPWPEGELRVRMGIHTGTPEVTQEGYVGADVHLGARICAAAWGGQILVSSTTTSLVSSDLEDVTLLPLGAHALKDIDQPVEFFQVLAPGLRADFPPPRAPGSHPNNLPPAPTSLIGRDHEVAHLASLLRQHDTRVVTLTGPGGTGKTRLALEVGHTLLPEFADGVFLVDLSATTDASLVVPQVASSLNLTESGGRSLTATLHDYLSSKDMLVLLDNFEQVTAAAPEIAALVSAAPKVRALVTSREPLRIAVEQEVAVPPLPVPADGSPDLYEVERSPAVALFVARVRRVRADFSLTADNAATLAAICRCLDGLPLALELAAARVKVLSPSALLERLEHSLKVLSSGRRDASDRQRTLRGAIAWSYDLLSPDEQMLFRRLGEFAGGWSLEAAEAVCGRRDLELDVLDGLASLVDKSLVRASDGDEDRFFMFETIREFAQEKLEDSGDVEDIGRAHAYFFRTLAAESYSAFAGAHQLATLATLRREQENLRAALQWATGAQSWIALDLCGNLWRFWRIDGQVAEGRKWLERSPQAPDTPRLVRARALRGLSVLAEMQHDYESARAAGVAAMALFEQLQDQAGVARCLETLASLSEEVGDYDEAVRHYSRTKEICKTLGDRHGVAVALGNLANVALLRQYYDAALGLISESKQLYAQQGDTEGMAVSLFNEGLALLGSGRTSESRRCLRRALALAEQLQHKVLMATALEGLAAEGALTGDAERAARLLGAGSHFRSDENALRDSLEERFYEGTLRRVRESLNEYEFELVFRDGQRHSTETVVAEAKGG